MEEHEYVVFVSPAYIEVDYIHYSVSLLQQVQCLIVLFTFYKLNGIIVELSQDYWDLILGNSQLLIVMFIESVVLVECATTI